MASTDAWPASLGTEGVLGKIASAKVLCVGAGGIGCELLKTLVCTGFRNIELIDLDTIETSNLNRQFLFHKRHVGQSKAAVAAEIIRGIKPDTNIVPHHANIKEPRFGIEFFSGFDIILNGLDNMEARRHVNRLCMAAQRPLIESGTAGYSGQVSVHIKGTTKCYECEPKAVQKSFPICTLRNTPDRPIHCVVWAKDLLFARLFGKPDEVSDLDEESAAPAANSNGARVADASGEDGARAEGASGEGEGDGASADGVKGPCALGEEAEAEAAAKADASFFLRREGEAPVPYAARVFGRAFGSDIQRLAGMADLWKQRAPPQALSLEDLLGAGWEEAMDTAMVPQKGSSASAVRALGLSDPNKKWSTADSARVFVASAALLLRERSAEVGALVFDKEDDILVEFVTSASNLRSDCFGISTQSLFDAKGMAGNIVHAIATTNATISGLIVIEALKVLCSATDSCRGTYVSTEKRFVATSRTEAPVAGCMVCGQAQLTLRANTETMTLGALLGEVVKKRLAVSVPMLQCGDFLYEEGEGLEEDEIEMYQALLKRPLAKLPGGGLVTGSIVAVKDETQCFNLELIVIHQEAFDETVPEGFTLAGAIPVAEAAAAEAGSAGAADAGDDSDLELMDGAPSYAAGRVPAANGGADGKRKRGGGGEGGDEGATGKKARAAAAGGKDEPIEM
ncbi:hypothetical protein FOA52_012906 [Chlamydomonas sp. UWO 241]|nr:hypothetical protein FOA52_012906 [Chlamydomonas sp. UWO 241]